jgi:hypothetical protein
MKLQGKSKEQYDAAEFMAFVGVTGVQYQYSAISFI